MRDEFEHWDEDHPPEGYRSVPIPPAQPRHKQQPRHEDEDADYVRVPITAVEVRWPFEVERAVSGPVVVAGVGL